MARVRGAVTVNSSYESTVAKPFDARTLVPSYDDLKDINNWLSSSGSRICYNGMFVAVANVNNPSENGLYMLFDATNTRKPDVSNDANWLKIGETADISDFADRLSTIEDDIDSIKDRLTALEESHDVETVAYRKNFPSKGKSNTLYVAVDEQKSYVWVDNDYLPVGGSDYEEPTIIYGGSAN
jgi:hypothetical protein